MMTPPWLWESASRGRMANGDHGSIWLVAREWAFLVVSALGGLVTLLFKWNWNALANKVQKNQDSIEALYAEKADKDEVDRKHAENRLAFAKLEAAMEKAEEVREKMWMHLANIDKSVGVLLDRSEREKEKHT